MTPKRKKAGLHPAGTAILVSLFDGARQPFDSKTQILLRVRDGFHNEVLSRFLTGNTLRVSVEFHDNFGDNYTVLVTCKHYLDVGFTPVKITKDANAPLDLMMLRKDATFRFRPWSEIMQTHPYVCRFLGCGLDEGDGQKQYESLMKRNPAALAALLSLTTAMSQIQLPRGTPLDYFKQLNWDASMKQDRFFGYCDLALIDQVRAAVQKGVFVSEPSPGLFHRGATSSYKQCQFGEANVQLTFHENDRKRVGNAECILAEPDIDCFSDVAAHTLLEVLPNTVSHGLTDPKMVYVSRWIAGRHAGVAEFDPPYTLL